MIDARFDDLTGASDSFRMIGPAGVVEARRADEVAGVIAAAEAAAAMGSWVAGFVAYEAAPGLDPALAVRRRADRDPFALLPLAWFAIFEGRERTVLPESQHDPVSGSHDRWRPSVDRATYDAAIERIRGHIAAGDTYQVNHTLRMRSRIEGDERGLYRDLCYAQRGAYSAYLNLGRYRVLSASPELFFRIDDARITTKPMKGTARRGRWSAEDDAVAESLRGSVKDRAENAMIVDMLRNDLGRVARTGSVTWSDVFDLERYETVWQLTSTVSADLEADAGLVDVFRALFPSGSVTGAPKVRTMEIVAELEDAPRGVYCGAVGFLCPPGSGAPRARFNVPIRTVVLDTDTHVAEYGVGGGITWGSSAEGEYDELLAKARVLTARRPRFELYETLRHDPATGFRHLERHLARLRSSAGYFGFGFDEHAVTDALWRSAARFPDRAARVRVSVDRRAHIDAAATALVESSEPVRVAIDRDHPVDPSDPMLFHKNSLRSVYEDALERHADADDVLLVNDRGEITETTIANVAVSLDATWVTPPLEAGLLPGVGREVALEQGWLMEATIRVEDLARADAIELVSDVRGRRPVLLVG
ncbi:MAG TPA: aminodeoxychorismate synthase component I [Actinomycetota bacterium]|nr:aminodeoxychorismate synthase component I [Actinomycetota bacterium]